MSLRSDCSFKEFAEFMYGEPISRQAMDLWQKEMMNHGAEPTHRIVVSPRNSGRRTQLEIYKKLLEMAEEHNVEEIITDDGIMARHLRRTQESIERAEMIAEGDAPVRPPTHIGGRLIYGDTDSFIEFDDDTVVSVIGNGMVDDNGVVNDVVFESVIQTKFTKDKENDLSRDVLNE